jgi:hypothetical protein
MAAMKRLGEHELGPQQTDAVHLERAGFCRLRRKRQVDVELRAGRR